MYKFHEISFSGYFVITPDGRTDGRTDMDKPISLRLRRGIITTNITLAVDRADTPVDCIGRKPLFHVQQIIHYLGLDQSAHMRIVNKIFPFSNERKMISIPNSKSTDQNVLLQMLI